MTYPRSHSCSALWATQSLLQPPNSATAGCGCAQTSDNEQARPLSRETRFRDTSTNFTQFHASQSITFCLISPPPLKDVKTSPSSQILQKQAPDRVWPPGCSLPIPDRLGDLQMWKNATAPIKKKKETCRDHSQAYFNHLVQSNCLTTKNMKHRAQPPGSNTATAHRKLAQA